MTSPARIGGLGQRRLTSLRKYDTNNSAVGSPTSPTLRRGLPDSALNRKMGAWLRVVLSEAKPSRRTDAKPVTARRGREKDYTAPSSSLAKDTWFSAMRQGFKSPWGWVEDEALVSVKSGEEFVYRCRPHAEDKTRRRRYRKVPFFFYGEA